MNTTGIQGSPAERRLPSWLGTGVAAGLSVAIVVAVLAAAITLPSNALLGNRPDANALAYANSGPGTFNPLDDGFVRGRLGDLLPTTAADARRPPLASTRLLPRTAPAGKRAGLPPVVKQAPLSNDDFVSAYPIEAVPFRGETKTSGASRQPSEPASCLPAGGTVWYRYTAPSALTVFANTFGSGYSLTLGAFEGSDLSNLRQVSCATSTAGNASSTFTTVAGRTYYFQMTGPVAGGHLRFTLVDQGANYEASAVKATSGKNSFFPTLSADGRYLTFTTGESEYAPRPHVCWPKTSDTCRSLIWRDLVTGDTRRLASVVQSSDENDPSHNNSILSSTVSADGGTVVFDGAGSGITPDKTSTLWDVFTADTRTGVVRRITDSWKGGDASPSTDPLAPVSTAPWSLLWPSRYGALNPSISSDGRFVAFMSDYADLYPGQPSSRYSQVFVKDLHTGSVRMVSVNKTGAPANGGSSVAYGHALSADGRFVAFDSYADDLAELPSTLGCTPQVRADACTGHVYLADAMRGVVQHVSRSVTGVSTGYSWLGTVSADGNHVVYTSDSDHLVAGDTNLATDVFTWNRLTEKTTLVSVDSDGRQGPGDTGPAEMTAAQLAFVACDLAYVYAQPAFDAAQTVGALTGQCPPSSKVFRALAVAANGGLQYPMTSKDGRYVSFGTMAPLVAEDTNGARDVYVRDTVTGATVRVSNGVGGQQSNGDSFMPFISDDASTIGFTSSADNLVANDANKSSWSVLVAPLNWTE